jgi:hypothetical protein
MKRRLAWTAIAVVIWQAWASWLVCYGLDADYSPPYLQQYADLAWHFRVMLWWPGRIIDLPKTYPLMWFVTASIPGVLILCLFASASLRRPAAPVSREPDRPLYGASEWPTRSEQVAGGITRRRF